MQPRDEVHLTVMLLSLLLFGYLSSIDMFIGSHLLGAFVAGPAALALALRPAPAAPDGWVFAASQSGGGVGCAVAEEKEEESPTILVALERRSGLGGHSRAGAL